MLLRVLGPFEASSTLSRPLISSSVTSMIVTEGMTLTRSLFSNSFSVATSLSDFFKPLDSLFQQVYPQSNSHTRMRVKGIGGTKPFLFWVHFFTEPTVSEEFITTILVPSVLSHPEDALFLFLSSFLSKIAFLHHPKGSRMSMLQ